MRNLVDKSSAISNRLKRLGLAIKASPPSLSRAKKLVFLCGANRDINVPSFRREAVKKFIERLSNDYSVIYAEAVFAELRNIGHRKNALDLEHEISEFADKIVIILESESAFCELGAFAHKTLREKLVVINDARFRASESFINTGPISAMGEVKAPVLWYPMSTMTRMSVDGIGATFSGLKEALDLNKSKRSLIVNRDLSDLKKDKVSLYFVHDFVLFCGPISYRELVDIFLVVFGDKRYDLLSSLLGILRAAGLIFGNKVGDVWVYRAAAMSPFLNYGIKTYSIMAAFRTFHLKNNPERFSFV